VRLAVGASRSQIVAQALVESVLLAIAGGVAGLLVAMGTARLLLALAFSNVAFLPIDTRPSLPILAFAFLLALVTGVVFGAAPAWFLTQIQSTRSAEADAARATDHRSHSVRCSCCRRRCRSSSSQARRCSVEA
jgi:hypothetical protein